MKYKIFKNKEQASKYVSDLIVKSITQKPNLNLGLATGSTPILTYDFLTQAFENENVDFKNVKTFNLDEYKDLKIENKNSYHFFMNKYLFSKVNININNTFFPKSNFNYDEFIQKNGGIDLQILGIGQNGHIGFNEPGSKKNSKTRIVDLTKSTIKANAKHFQDESEVPIQAYSMGLETIFKAKKIILLAFGNSKKEIIKELKKIDEFSENIPASILYEHKDVTIILDEEANSDL